MSPAKWWQFGLDLNVLTSGITYQIGSMNKTQRIQLILFQDQKFQHRRPGDANWRHRSWSTLVQVITWCLTVPSHYLNQWWLIIKVRPCGILLRAVSQEKLNMLKRAIFDMSLSMLRINNLNLRLQTHVPWSADQWVNGRSWSKLTLDSYQGEAWAHVTFLKCIRRNLAQDTLLKIGVIWTPLLNTLCLSNTWPTLNIFNNQECVGKGVT